MPIFSLLKIKTLTVLKTPPPIANWKQIAPNNSPEYRNLKYLLYGYISICVIKIFGVKVPA
jgi:hypothetical protein